MIIGADMNRASLLASGSHHLNGSSADDNDLGQDQPRGQGQSNYSNSPSLNLNVGDNKKTSSRHPILAGSGLSQGRRGDVCRFPSHWLSEQ